MRYLEEDFCPKIQLKDDKVSEIFGSGKASFTAKNPDCYIVTQEQNGYALVVDGKVLKSDNNGKTPKYKR